jgi:T5SS/PEP-CTERM-associated repeat protein
MRCTTWATIAVVLFSGSAARAAITTSGNLTGGGTPYAGQDPWNTTGLVVGDTAPGTMSISSGSVVNNDGTFIVANSAGGSNSSVTIDGAGSTMTNSGTFILGNEGAAALVIKSGGLLSTGTSEDVDNNFFDLLNGNVTVDGAGSQLDAGSQFFGRLAVGPPPPFGSTDPPQTGAATLNRRNRWSEFQWRTVRAGQRPNTQGDWHGRGRDRRRQRFGD